MPSLLLVVFTLQLIISLVSAVGSSTVNNTLWSLYNRLPTSTSKAVREQRRLQREYLGVRTQMNNTSSQDEFAKWAKLRRQHDKLLAELEKTSASLSTAKTSFDSVVSVIQWTATNGLRWLLQFWYARQAMFWIPQGWLPSYVEWLLAFPRAPTGAVSIQVWWLACANVIQLVLEVASALYAFWIGNTANGAQRKGATRATPIPARSEDRANTRKKEL